MYLDKRKLELEAEFQAALTALQNTHFDFTPQGETKFMAALERCNILRSTRWELEQKIAEVDLQ